jgi:hypothetical protein
MKVNTHAVNIIKKNLILKNSKPDKNTSYNTNRKTININTINTMKINKINSVLVAEGIWFIFTGYSFLVQ